MTFKDLITSESEKLRSLHEAIHETVIFRDRSPSANEAWRRACEDFHSYESRLSPYLERVFSDSDYKDQETIEFVISFLELDPRFFRSGYIKEEMLRKIGRAELNSKQIVRLRVVLLDAVQRRGGREFRRYCRVAAQIGHDDLLAELRSLSSEGDSAGSRAKMMLRYVEQASLER
jgi:hypothetical protein